jgi:hypothetical protein
MAPVHDNSSGLRGSRGTRLGASGNVPGSNKVYRTPNAARGRSKKTEQAGTPVLSSSSSWKPPTSGNSKQKKGTTQSERGSREGTAASALGVLRSGGIGTPQFGREGEELAAALAGGRLPQAPLAMDVLSEMCRARKSKVAAKAFQELASMGVGFGYMDYHRMVQMLVKVGRYSGPPSRRI